MKTKVIIITAALLVTTFAKEDKPVAAASAATSQSESEDSAVLKVKGLYIGMDIKAAYAALDEKIGKKWGVDSVTKEPNGRFAVRIMAFADPIAAIMADADGKVTSIYFKKPIVDDLFESKGMQPSEFAKRFVTAYKIPSMKPSDDLLYWQYSSPDGYRVVITVEKELLIQKTATDQEKNKAFD